MLPPPSLRSAAGAYRRPASRSSPSPADHRRSAPQADAARRLGHAPAAIPAVPPTLPQPHAVLRRGSSPTAAAFLPRVPPLFLPQPRAAAASWALGRRHTWPSRPLPPSTACRRGLRRHHLLPFLPTPCSKPRRRPARCRRSEQRRLPSRVPLPLSI